MGKRKFALERGGPKTLVVSWRRGWSDLAVELDGQRVLHVKDRAALGKGATAALPDGRGLRVALESSVLAAELDVRIDGRPVPGSVNDPRKMIEDAATIVFVVAGVTFVLGVVAAAADVTFLQNLGLGWMAAGIGACLGLLGWLVRQKASATALAVAVGVLALDIVATIVVALNDGTRLYFPGLFVKALLMMGMIRGFSGIELLKKEQALAPRAGPGTGD